MAGEEATRWLGGLSCIDIATFRPAQVIYTAAPILAPGARDPMPNGRLFRAPGEAEVQAPSAAELAPPPKPEFHPRQSRPGDAAESRLAALVRFAATAPEKQRNSRLYWAGCRAAELVAERLCPASVAKAALVEAGKHCGLPEKEVVGTVASALRQAGAA